MISNLQSASATTAAAANTATTADLATNSSANSTQKSEKKTYAQIVEALTDQIADNENFLQKVGAASKNQARSKSRTQTSDKNSAKNSSTKSAAIYRERRLILLNSKKSIFDLIKTRDLVNQSLTRELNLSANKPVLAAITRLYN